MTCRRCRGLMVADHFLDMAGGYGEMWVQSLRCVNCGTVDDAVIEQHRLAGEANVSVGAGGQSNSEGDSTYLGGEAFVRPAA